MPSAGPAVGIQGAPARRRPPVPRVAASRARSHRPARGISQPGFVRPCLADSAVARPRRSLCPAARPTRTGTAAGRWRSRTRPLTRIAEHGQGRAAPGQTRPSSRQRGAAVGQGSDACNSRLPSFARSAILLPQPCPQCIAQPDSTVHRGPRAPRTPRFTAAPGQRRACAVGGAIPGGLEAFGLSPLGAQSVPEC